MSILSKLQALLTAANTTTGESDTTLTDAMQTLIDGYGQGGGTPASLIDYERITFTSDATQTNKLTLQLTPVTNYFLIIFNISSISAPQEGFTALGHARAHFVTNDLNEGALLRANGTQGSDNSMMTYNPSTGILSLGGEYGYFRTGDTYDVYLFEHGNVS